MYSGNKTTIIELTKVISQLVCHAVNNDWNVPRNRPCVRTANEHHVVYL